MKSPLARPLAAALFFVLSLVSFGNVQDDPPPVEADVFVVVVDEDGEPMEGATVMLVPTAAIRARGPSLISPSMTDGEGRVSLRVAVGEARDIRVRAPRGDGESLRREIPALVEGQVHDVEVVLHTRDDAFFAGLVVDSETGQPVEGAAVGTYGRGERFIGRQSSAKRLNPPTAPLAASDGKGLFKVEAATWRKQGLGVFAPGYAPRLLTVGGTVGAPGLGPEPWRIELVRPATIQFEVLEPPADLTVRALIWNSSYYDLKGGSSSRPLIDQYRLDAWEFEGEGVGEEEAESRTFVVEGLPPNKDVQIEFYQGAKMIRIEENVRTPGPGGDRRMTLDLFTSGIVEVVALGLDGEPLAGLELWIGTGPSAGGSALRFEGYDEPLATTVTDDNGRARFEGLAIGRYLVAPKGASYYSKPFPKTATLGGSIEITREDPRGEATLETVETLSISGVLKDESGKPAPGHIMAFRKGFGWSRQLSAGPDGKFELGGLIPGVYSVSGAAMDSVRSKPVDVKAGTADVEILSRAAGQVTGRVIVAETGKAVPEADVRFCDTLTGNQHLLKLDAEGRFEFKKAIAGKHHMLAWTAGGLISPVLPVEVPSGGHLDNVTIALDQGAILEISAPSSDSRTTVWVTTADGGSIIRSASPADPVRMTVPAGPIDVTVKQPEAGLATSFKLNLGPGETRVEQVELEPVGED